MALKNQAACFKVIAVAADRGVADPINDAG